MPSIMSANKTSRFFLTTCFSTFSVFVFFSHAHFLSTTQSTLSDQHIAFYQQRQKLNHQQQNHQFQVLKNPHQPQLIDEGDKKSFLKWNGFKKHMKKAFKKHRSVEKQIENISKNKINKNDGKKKVKSLRNEKLIEDSSENDADDFENQRDDNQKSELLCFLNGDQLDWIQILDFVSSQKKNFSAKIRPKQRTNYYSGKGQPNLIYPKYHKFNSDNYDEFDEGYYSSKSNRRTNNKNASYWLVPPFLIGALSICFAYVAIHCIYNHCHCGNKQSNTTTAPPSQPRKSVECHQHNHKKRVRRVHLVNASLPPNQLPADARLRFA